MERTCEKQVVIHLNCVTVVSCHMSSLYPFRSPPSALDGNEICSDGWCTFYFHKFFRKKRVKSLETNSTVYLLCTLLCLCIRLFDFVLKLKRTISTCVCCACETKKKLLGCLFLFLLSIDSHRSNVQYQVKETSRNVYL